MAKQNKTGGSGVRPWIICQLRSFLVWDLGPRLPSPSPMFCICRMNTSLPPATLEAKSHLGSLPPGPPAPGTVPSSCRVPMVMFAELGDEQRTSAAPSVGPGTPQQGKMLRTLGLSLFLSQQNNRR